MRRPLHLLAGIVALVSLLGPATTAVAQTAPSVLGPATPAVAQTSPVAPPAVTAGGAVLWDPADDKVLYGKEEAVPRPMASLTKIMTVLLALEAGTLGDVVTVSPAAAQLGGATLDLAPGQTLPMESLVAGLLLRSGNDAARAVAEHVAGSDEAFIARMNVRAAEVGLEATNFVNASGLTDDPLHVSSPTDLARLAELAMGLEVFARYAGAPTATVPGLPPMVSRNELLGAYPGATGVKTGFTSRAGLCLVASATRDGRTLYVAVLDSTNSFSDATALLDYGFAAFRRAQPVPTDGPATRYRWAGDETPLTLAAPLALTVPAGSRVTWRTLVEPALERPLASGAAAGTAELLVDDAVALRVPLILGAAVDPPPERTPAGTVGAALHEALRTLARLETIDRAE